MTSTKNTSRYIAGVDQSATVMSRRAALTGMSTLAAFASSVGRSRAQTTAAYHRFKVGSAEITVISDGTMTLPMSFALPAAPRREADAMLSANRLPTDAIQSPLNVTLIKTATDLILIDTGAGGDFMPGLGKFAEVLESAGFKPEAVTKLIFTHAHPDHLWGVIDPLDDGTRFPNATHIMSRVEFDYWSAPDVASRVAEPFQRATMGTNRRLNLIGDRVKMHKPGDEVAPGVVLVDTAGHTPGHVSILIKSGTDQILIGGDVLTQSVVSFQKPDWPWGSDMDAERAIASRKRTLEMLATDRIPLLGYHMPWPGVGRVERKDAAYRFVAV